MRQEAGSRSGSTPPAPLEEVLPVDTSITEERENEPLELRSAARVLDVDMAEQVTVLMDQPRRARKVREPGDAGSREAPGAPWHPPGDPEDRGRREQSRDARPIGDDRGCAGLPGIFLDPAERSAKALRIVIVLDIKAPRV